MAERVGIIGLGIMGGAMMRNLSQAGFDIVGFTTPFEQNLASLALARLIKTRYPQITIVFGGGNCESVTRAGRRRSMSMEDAV